MPSFDSLYPDSVAYGTYVICGALKVRHYSIVGSVTLPFSKLLGSRSCWQVNLEYEAMASKKISSVV